MTPRRIVAIASIGLVVSCAIAPLGSRHGEPLARAVPRAPRASGPKTVVLLALDGVRWQEVFEGVEQERARAAGIGEQAELKADELMPRLHRLLRTRGGAIGAPRVGEPIAASGPSYLSLPGYVEMSTGMRAHGCADNSCRGADSSTVADDFAAWFAARPGEVGVVASWPGVGLGAARDPRVLVSAGRNDGRHRELLRLTAESAALLRAGDEADPYPGTQSYRPDRFTAAIALDHLRRARPRFLFIGLGDTDEHAHRRDYGGYLDALRFADRVIGEVSDALADMSATGHPAVLFVTTDHGRAASFFDHGRDAPESGRVWLVAAGDGILARGYVPSPSRRYLADVATTLRAVAGLPSAPWEQGSVLDELFVPRGAAPRVSGF